MTSSDAVERAAIRWPEAPALEGPRRRWSFRELNEEVERLAGSLRSLRSPRDASDLPRSVPRLALVLEGRADTALLLHAGPRAGFTVAPLSSSLTSAELSSALSTLEPTAVYCDAATEERVRQALSGLATAVDPDLGTAPRPRLLTADEMLGRADTLPSSERHRGETSRERVAKRGKPPDGGPEGGEASRRAPGLSADEPRYVVWTSGSSGRPRGVLLTGNGLAAVVEGSARRLSLSSSDRWLTTLSLAHVGGLATVLRTAQLGSTLVARDGFDAEELLALASEGRVSHASLVPVMLRRILAVGVPAPPGLRCLLVGGARTPPDLVEEAVGLGYPVALTYGMTETSSQSATAPPEKVRRKPHGVGTALPGVEIRIAEDREIRVRGPSLAVGYLSPEHSPSEGSGSVPLELDDEGWYRTGDLGEWDRDGDLVVTGRRSERIITGGVTVDPREVEEALLAMPEVADAVVVGIPDEDWGERVCAAVVAAATDVATPGSVGPAGAPGEVEEGGPSDAGARADDERQLEERIRERVEAETRLRLSGPKRPRLLRVLPALPRTPTGKVDRAEVRRLMRDPLP